MIEKIEKYIFPSVFVNPGLTETVNISKLIVNYMGKQNMTSKVAYLISLLFCGFYLSIHRSVFKLKALLFERFFSTTN